MALVNVLDADNGIKVGDLITAYHSGYWIVTSIEKRFVTEKEEIQLQGRYGKAGDAKNSLINYELAFDSKFKPSGKKKKTKHCDSSFCYKVDEAFITEAIKQKVDEIQAISSFAQKAKVTSFPLRCVSLSPIQSSYAIKRIGLWLDTVKYAKSSADADHSALLFRVLSGKDPLPKRPPLKNACPWYELGEGNKIELDPNFDNEVTVNGTKVTFGNAGPFEWVNQREGLVVYPPSGENFKVWKEGKKRFIQKISENSFKPLEIDGKWTGCDHCGSVDCDGKECIQDKASKSIGKCPKCHTPVYSEVGFCGVCEPHKL